MTDAILLDCDGVITDKRARVDSRVVFEAFRIVHSGKKVAFVTGRSLSWMVKNIIPVIEHFKPSAEEKKRFFFVGECGNRWLSFSNAAGGSGFARGSDDSEAVPASVQSEVAQEMHRFSYLRFDDTKESMVSLEVLHAKITSAQADSEAQRELIEARDFFALKHPEFYVIKTLYAMDIVTKGVGKGSAARRALELMENVSHALIVGDSEIDLEMGDELQTKGIPFEFYYVGEGVIPRKPFPVKKAAGHFADGTLEILRGVR